MKVNLIFPDSEKLETLELELPIIPNVFSLTNTFAGSPKASKDYDYNDRKYWKPKLVVAVVTVHGTNDDDRKTQWLNGYREAIKDNATRYGLASEKAMDITNGEHPIDSTWYEVYVERTNNPFKSNF